MPTFGVTVGCRGMRKTIMIAIAGAALAVAPALAKPTHSPHPVKPDHPAKSHKCKTHNVGYNAKGLLVSHTLTQTQGTATPTDTSDDRYSGDITVNVTKANHKAPKGEQTFTVTDAKVRFYDAAGDGTNDPPVAGDKVSLHGKVSKTQKKCTPAATTFTVKSISFKQAAPAPAPETAPTT
jgi:hypothetical protein